MHVEILQVRERERNQGLKEGDLIHTITDKWNESNISENASSRMLTVDGIVEYYWTGNPKILVFNNDGTWNLPGSVEDPLPSKEPRKFLIYVSLSYHRKLFGKVPDYNVCLLLRPHRLTLLLQMFDIKKRRYVFYDGSMTPKSRQKAVDTFTTDPDCRIMVISNVGAAGLNLVAASVVIIVVSGRLGHPSLH